MTVNLKDLGAVADLLDHVAELVRQGQVDGLSIAMANGNARVSVQFSPGSKETLPGSEDLEEESTKPGNVIDQKVDVD